MGIWGEDIDHRDELITCGEELKDCVCACLDCGETWLWDCECIDSLYAAPRFLPQILDATCSSQMPCAWRRYE